MGTERFYKPGSWYRVCDRTGFATRAERTQGEWNGLIVKTGVWEARHPQDFVRGVTDNQNVPNPRPRNTDAYQGALTTYLTTDAKIRDNILNVYDTERMYAGDTVWLILDNGLTHKTSIYTVANLTQLQINDVLPWTAAAGNVLTNLSAISSPSIG